MRQILVTIFSCLALTVMAQQESLRMVYPFIPLSINPAEAGNKGVASVTGIFRRKPLFQQTGGATSSQQYFSFDMPIQQEKWGIGFLAYNTDQSYSLMGGGVAANLGLAGILSKRFVVAKGQNLQLGLNLGLNQYPILGRNGTSEFGGSLGFGVAYQFDKLEIGLSRPTQSLRNLEWSNPNPIYARMAYTLPAGQGNWLKFGALMRHQIADTRVDLHGTFWWQEKLGLGLWWQNTGSEFSNEALLGSIEVPLGRNFRVGYAYDFLGRNSVYFTPGTSNTGTSSVQTAASGYHQIFIRYEIDLGNGKIANFRL
ncbi:type IX secretion system membrane protein PorP/SprF [Aquirufa rosea]|nr:type IX secretion system membrane protein PorP/SprF [Aquirufa rosea]